MAEASQRCLNHSYVALPGKQSHGLDCFLSRDVVRVPKSGGNCSENLDALAVPHGLLKRQEGLPKDIRKHWTA